MFSRSIWIAEIRGIHSYALVLSPSISFNASIKLQKGIDICCRMVTVKRHLPYSGHEGLQEVRKIFERSKENIYTAATSRSDYLRRISLKMLIIDTKPRRPIVILYLGMKVEYYFSDENLRTDKFLLKYLAKDEEGYVPVAVIASFKKMKKLTHHKSFIVVALKESFLLTLSSNEKKVKRVHPFPLTEALDIELCTILVENLPEDQTIENMKKIFCEAGRIKKIIIHEENATREQKKCSIEEKLLSGNVSFHNSECCVQLHAVVEYDTLEAAENAVATLNNEQDCRHGMRVKLLKCKVIPSFLLESSILTQYHKP
ncbi:hypothetical protein L2E82_43751 [Cichorium intybus]|uniref:Uncharacterized protein n=1 Tax=Cichorium intybus TaxID=13427 RepID=A0ACB8ZQD9_CICIN|nr:hypothetical protein L2E82_43751 [Cichorium intybus]